MASGVTSVRVSLDRHRGSSRGGMTTLRPPRTSKGPSPGPRFHCRHGRLLAVFQLLPERPSSYAELQTGFQPISPRLSPCPGVVVHQRVYRAMSPRRQQEPPPHVAHRSECHGPPGHSRAERQGNQRHPASPVRRTIAPHRMSASRPSRSDAAGKSSSRKRHMLVIGRTTRQQSGAKGHARTSRAATQYRP